MTAGTGIVHSEYNASEVEPVHSIQIWIIPEAEDFTPSYQQFAFSPSEKQGRLRLLAAPGKSSPNGNGSVATIHQDAFLYVAELNSGDTVRHTLAEGRHAWVQVARGNVVINGHPLGEGDAAALSEEPEVRAEGGADGGEFLLFDLA
jgi:redox-sensitive bicupin YhaK (pirin superfamily)